MHTGQTEATPAQVADLLADQMPELAGLPLRRVGRTGTDNVLYRIGPALVGRFPRLPHAEAQLSIQARWLPRLSQALPLTVPLIQRFGLPGAGYHYRWTILPWLPGHAAFAGPLDQEAAARTLAGFILALRAQPLPEGAPHRGEADALAPRFATLAPAISQFQGEADPLTLARIAAALRKLPPFAGQPAWVHGDLHAMNLLASRGRLCGVIDWGGLGIGDPAMDLWGAWTLFDAPARGLFRDLLAAPEEDWARGRAMAFAKAVAAVPYYRRSNPGFRAVMLRCLHRVMEELAAG